MKDFKYIASKIFKRNFCIVLMLAVCFFAVCLNLYNGHKAYASEQIALVECKAILVDGVNETILSKDTKMFSNFEISSASLCNVGVKINSTSNIEYVYVVNNISSSQCLAKLNLEKNQLKNFKVEYYINEDYVDIANCSTVVPSGETVEIKVVMSIDNIAKNAALDGRINISISKVGA